jgi:hypothetical protein
MQHVAAAGMPPFGGMPPQQPLRAAPAVAAVPQQQQQQQQYAPAPARGRAAGGAGRSAGTAQLLDSLPLPMETGGLDMSAFDFEVRPSRTHGGGELRVVSSSQMWR